MDDDEIYFQKVEFLPNPIPGFWPMKELTREEIEEMYPSNKSVLEEK